MSGQVLRRKIKVVRQAAKGGGASPVERAWRVGFARALRDAAHVQAEFDSVNLSHMSLAEVLELPAERALILTLDGPESGLGVVLMAPDVMSALVETMTLGRCAATAGETRKPTRTDAAMMAPVVDNALRYLESALAETADLVWTSDFHFASCLEDARPLALLLEDVPYRVIGGVLSLSGGARQGGITLVLPSNGKGRKSVASVNSIPAELAGTFFTARIAAQVEQAQVRVDAILARKSMPISEAIALKPGMVLDLSNAMLDQISLEGLDGRKVASGKLGQHRGMRALRLTDQLAQVLQPVKGLPAHLRATPASGKAEPERDGAAPHLAATGT